jgi:hypothetical protein
MAMCLDFIEIRYLWTYVTHCSSSFANFSA